jgi:hypothetical protein
MNVWRTEYIYPETWPDELFILNRSYSNIIFAGETALKEFFRKKNVDYSKLLEYATALNVKEDIEKYLNRKLVLHPNDEYEVFEVDKN